MYIFKNQHGHVYTCTIDVKHPKTFRSNRSKMSNNAYFKGFFYQFEELNGSIGGFIVVCPIDAWVDSWLQNIQKDDTTAYAVKLLESHPPIELAE